MCGEGAVVSPSAGKPSTLPLCSRMVPVEYQLLVVNSFTIMDSAFMSFAGNNDLGAMLVDVPVLGPLICGGAAAAAQQPKQQRQKDKRQEIKDK